MKRKRHTPEQIIRKLRTAEQLLNQGQSVADVCRALELSSPTYHRWQQLYGGMKVTEAKRLKELEQENARLKRLLADAELDKAMLKELAEGNFLARSDAAEPCVFCRIDSEYPSAVLAGWPARTATRSAGR